MAAKNGTTQARLSNSILTADDMTPERVEELYWDEEMSQYDIADLFNTGQWTVSQRMSDWEIPTRERGQAGALARGHITLDTREQNTTKKTEQTLDARESDAFGALQIESERNIENRDDGIYAVTEYVVTLTGISTEFVTTEETQLLPDRVSL